MQGTILVRCQWLLATRLSFLKTTAAVGFECARMANKDIFPSLMSSSDDRSQIEHSSCQETRKGYLSRSIMQAHFFISEYTPGIWLDVGLIQLFFLIIFVPSSSTSLDPSTVLATDVFGTRVRKFSLCLCVFC